MERDQGIWALERTAERQAVVVRGDVAYESTDG